MCLLSYLHAFSHTTHYTHDMHTHIYTCAYPQISTSSLQDHTFRKSFAIHFMPSPAMKAMKKAKAAAGAPAPAMNAIKDVCLGIRGRIRFVYLVVT